MRSCVDERPRRTVAFVRVWDDEARGIVGFVELLVLGRVPLGGLGGSSVSPSSVFDCSLSRGDKGTPSLMPRGGSGKGGVIGDRFVLRFSVDIWCFLGLILFALDVLRKSFSPEDEFSPNTPFMPSTKASIISTPKMGAATATLSIENGALWTTGVCGGENDERFNVDALCRNSGKVLVTEDLDLGLDKLEEAACDFMGAE